MSSSNPSQTEPSETPAPVNLHRRLWLLAWPMMLSNITVPLLGLVDTAVLGHLEESKYLAGVALGTTLFTSVFWLFGFLRMGTCGMTAQAVGSQNTPRILQLLLSSGWLAVFIGLLLVLLSPLWMPLGLSLLAGNDATSNHEIYLQATLYAQWRILGAPFVLLNYAIIGWFVGRQNTKIPLYMLVVANLINILLDLILVIGFGMNVEGVALATLSADISATLLGGTFILYHYRDEFQKIHRWLPHLKTLKEMVFINRYIFVRTGTLLFTFALFTAQGARIGEETLAANAVLLTFLLLISNALDGFAHGAEALVGEACGQKNHGKVVNVIRVCLIWSAISALILTLAFFLGGSLLISWLTDLSHIRALANQYLPWLAAMPLIGVWCYTYDGVFIGSTKVQAMQNIMLVSTFLIFLPLIGFSQYLGLNQYFGFSQSEQWQNHGLWLAMSAFIAARSLGMALCSRHYSKHRQWFS
ncbi:MATE family efflux transporter [Litoribacillus peritrichatus]|uniref:MATE family efflux transporter DinF n=1 Tax=Litoribacillus peritrichatus TaxID=718191 RepID=A0ABP7NDJ3_9GAMM